MAKGWTAISIPEEVHEKAKEYYEKHKEELKIRHGIRSFSAFVNFCLREYLKKIGAL